MVERWANQSFENHLCPRRQGTDNENTDDSRNAGYCPFSDPTRLLARERCAEFSRRETTGPSAYFQWVQTLRLETALRLINQKMQLNYPFSSRQYLKEKSRNPC